MINELDLLWVPNFIALGIYFLFGTKFSWNEGIGTCFNVECVLLGRNFYFLGGYCWLLLVTWWLLLDTARYWWLLLVTARYCSFLLLVWTFYIINIRWYVNKVASIHVIYLVFDWQTSYLSTYILIAFVSDFCRRKVSFSSCKVSLSCLFLYISFLIADSEFNDLYFRFRSCFAFLVSLNSVCWSSSIWLPLLDLS